MKSTIKISRGQLENVFKEYATIALLTADQANQSSNRIYKVIDASDDPNLTFPVGETRKYAYYKYKENANELIGDYTLISAPYSNHSGGGGDTFTDYPNTAAMIAADQATQENQVVYAVADASDDSNITFANGETKRQAYYRYNGVATGSIDDYTLISAPYAVPKEGDIYGTAVEYTAEGGEPVDISQASHYNVDVVLNSIITLTGLPPVGKSYTRTINAVSQTGAEDLSFANATNEFGSYDPTKVNFITIRVSNTTNTGVVINVFYEQPEIIE